MVDSTTPNYGWFYPTNNADADTWGLTLNTTIIAIDAQVKTVSDAIATGDNLRLAKASNLSDLASAATARTNLGLGTAAVANASDNAGTVAGLGGGGYPADSIPKWGPTSNGTLVNSGIAYTNIMQKQNNLSEVQSAATSRSNLGLGTAAVATASDNGAVVASVNGGNYPAGSIPKWTGSAGTLTNSGISAADILLRQNNLGDVQSAATSRNNLGLSTGATTTIGGATGSGAPSGGNDGDIFFRYI